MAGVRGRSVAETGSIEVGPWDQPESDPTPIGQTRVRIDHARGFLEFTSIRPERARRSFGRYRLTAPLGSGGMGIVHRAWDPELRREIAVKVIRTDKRKHKMARRLSARLAREAQALARLSHPNVVPVYDVGIEDGAVFVAMAYIHGRTLRSWVATAPRTPAEICAIFIAAGRGLAAAHAAGIIHRDFKPGNVLVTDDGRVYVADFGLARADRADTSGDEPATEPAVELAEDSAHALTLETLTDHNAALGTLPYMAPEQHLGRPLDERADQYAFCVSLFETLYGKRPFAADTSQAMLARKIRNRLPLLPPVREVPRWLHRIVTRGLSPRAGDRFATMHVLIAAIERGLARGARPYRAKWLALPLALTAAAASFAFAASENTTVCGAGEDLTTPWNIDQAARLREAFVATGLPYAADTAARVHARLDQFDARWHATRLQLCQESATEPVEPEASDTTLDPRTTCLRRGREQLRGLLEAMLDADDDVVSRAVSAAASLPAPRGCLNARSALPLPGSVLALAPDIDALRSELARAHGKGSAGHFDAALQQLVGVRAEAEETGYAPLVAEVLLERGRLEQQLGWHATAERTLTEAFWMATDQSYDALAYDAATDLVFVVGYSRARPEHGMDWSRHAAAASHRINGDATRSLDWLAHVGTVELQAGRLDDARAHLELALERCETGEGNDGALRCASASVDLGAVLRQQGHYEDARALLDRARRAHQRLLGPEHPRVADDLLQLGIADRGAGRFEDALAELQQAMVLRLASLGQHVDVALAEHQVGSTLVSMGRYAEARERLDSAVLRFESVSASPRATTRGPSPLDVAPILEELGSLAMLQGDFSGAAVYLTRGAALLSSQLGADHPDLAAFSHGLGAVALQRGDLDSARSHHRHARRLRVAAHGAQHPTVALAELGLGSVALAEGHAQDAKTHIGRALEIQEAALGPDHPQVARTLVDLARALVATAQSTEATGRVTRALAILEPLGDPAQLGEAHFVLARALATHARAPAIAEARRAQALLAAAGASSAGLREQVDAWLQAWVEANPTRVRRH